MALRRRRDTRRPRAPRSCAPPLAAIPAPRRSPARPPAVLPTRAAIDASVLPDVGTGGTSEFGRKLLPLPGKGALFRLSARGSFDSVDAPIAAIEQYLATYNVNPTRFTWTKDADMILAKITRCKAALGIP